MQQARTFPSYRPDPDPGPRAEPGPAPRPVPAALTPEGTLPPLGVIVFNRAAFGPRPGDIDAFQALGSDDESRLAAWVDDQLAPDPDEANDTDYWHRRQGLAGFPHPHLDHLGLTLQQLWQTFRNHPNSAGRPAEEVRLDTFTRMVASRWQLREVLVDLWMNHLNVHAYETYTRETFVHWNRDVIRAHVFGNFRSMLEASARSTPMLYYLDNYTNTRQGPNENYARELVEIHTLGAGRYLGVTNPASVPAAGTWPAGSPLAGQPAPAGYCDNDVYETSRCLTGWGVDPTTGLFLYTDGNHDRFSKTVLNFGLLNVPADQGSLVDGLYVLDLLASHPGTGRHLAEKLCRRLVADNPPQALVDEVATGLTADWQAPDQLARAVRAILLSPAFRTTWGEKVKRPVEFVASAMRLFAGPSWFFGFTDWDPGDGDGYEVEADTASLFSRVSRAGQMLFGRIPPDGYPDRKQEWTGSNTRVQCWRLAGWLVDQRDEANPDPDAYRLDVLAATQSLPAGQRSPNAIADFWIGRAFGRTLDPAVRAQVVTFLAQGASPATDLNLASSSVKSRLRSMVALLLMTPEFLYR
jgi:uncharacterized protein (DUF1800 family)